MEVTMSTTLISHRPAPFIAAAVAVAAIAAGSVALSVSQSTHDPSAPGDQSQTSVGHDTTRAHHFHPTTSGGLVMVGE
jgi:hypothetical protein